MSIPSGPQYTHLMAASSRIRFHVTSTNQTGCLNMWVSALSLDLNLIEHPLEYGGAGESHQGYAAKNGFDTKKNPERDMSFTVTKHSEAENQRKVTERNYWEFFFFHVLWMFKPSSFPWQLTSRNLTFLDCFPQDLTHSDPDINALRKHYVYGKDTTCKLKQQAEGLLLKNQSYQGCFDTFLR